MNERPYPNSSSKPGAAPRQDYAPQTAYPSEGAAGQDPALQGGARARRARRRRSRRIAAVVFILLLAGALLALTVAAPYAYFQISRRILPGVWAGPTYLGGKTLTDAAIALQKEWNLEGAIAVDDGLQTVYLRPGDLGVTVDPSASAALAYQIGHNQNMAAELAAFWRCIGLGCRIFPVVQIDPAAARAGLETLAAQTRIAPQNASVRLENGRPVVVPPAIGHTLNIESALAQIQADPAKLIAEGRLAVPLQPLAPAVEDVSAVITSIEALLTNPQPLRGYDPVFNETLEWPLTPELVAGWLRVEDHADGPQVRFDENAVAAYLQQVSQSLEPARYLDVSRYAPEIAAGFAYNQAPVVRIQHHPTPYVVQAGDTLLKIAWRLGMPFWRIIQANPDMDPENLITGQTLAIPSRDDLLPLPIVPNKRIVISISQQQLWTYQDGRLRSEHVISTGVDRSPTQPGVFQVQTHELEAYASIWDLYMPNFLGIYEAWPGFMNGLHGLPTLSSGRQLWANILGRPASYGCIILDIPTAKDLYNWAENGVIVEIQP